MPCTWDWFGVGWSRFKNIYSSDWGYKCIKAEVQGIHWERSIVYLFFVKHMSTCTMIHRVSRSRLHELILHSFRTQGLAHFVEQYQSTFVVGHDNRGELLTVHRYAAERSIITFQDISNSNPILSLLILSFFSSSLPSWALSDCGNMITVHFESCQCLFVRRTGVFCNPMGTQQSVYSCVL